MNLRRTIGAASALAFLALGVIASSPAQATHLGCGQVITQNTTLQSDVGPCPGPVAITIAANNVTLNLNGHRVFGFPQSGPSPSGGAPRAGEGDGVGILFNNVTGSTVQNGTVELFDVGVLIRRGGGNTVQKVLAQDNVNISRGTEFGDGILIQGSINNKVLNNTVRRNGQFSGIAIIAEVEKALVGGANPGTSPFNAGRAVGTLPTGNLISKNKVSDNNLVFADQGIRLEGPGAQGNTVSSNMIDGGDGLTGGGNNHGIFIAAAFNGFASNPPTLTPPNPANQFNTLDKNTTKDNFGSGIRIRGTQDPTSFANNNTVKNNIATGNRFSGIYNERPAFENKFLNNYAVDNNRAGSLNPLSAADLVDSWFDPPCDNNTWDGNRYELVNQPCVANGGTDVDGPPSIAPPLPPPAAARAAAASDEPAQVDSINEGGRLLLEPAS